MMEFLPKRFGRWSVLSIFHRLGEPFKAVGYDAGSVAETNLLGPGSCQFSFAGQLCLPLVHELAIRRTCRTGPSRL